MSLVYDSEAETYTCPIHGDVTEDTGWVQCYAGCDDGYFDAYADDPINCDPGEIDTCRECRGKGGFVVCAICNRDNPEMEQNTMTSPVNKRYAERISQVTIQERAECSRIARENSELRLKAETLETNAEVLKVRNASLEKSQLGFKAEKMPMTEQAKHSASTVGDLYAQVCREACQWCAKHLDGERKVTGVLPQSAPNFVHKVYPPYVSTPFSDYLKCTAPTLLEWAATLHAQLEAAKARVDALNRAPDPVREQLVAALKAMYPFVYVTDHASRADVLGQYHAALNAAGVE